MCIFSRYWWRILARRMIVYTMILNYFTRNIGGGVYGNTGVSTFYSAYSILDMELGRLPEVGVEKPKRQNCLVSCYPVLKPVWFTSLCANSAKQKG